MADNTIVSIGKQYLNKAGKSTDAALQPSIKYEGLNENASSRYIGMEKIVLNQDGATSYPMKFYLKGGTVMRHWQIKEIFPVPTHEALDNLAAFTVGLGLPIAKFTKGLEVTVVADEKNENKPTKYWIAAVDATANTVTWERCNGNSSAAPSITVEGADMESVGV